MSAIRSGFLGEYVLHDTLNLIRESPEPDSTPGHKGRVQINLAGIGRRIDRLLHETERTTGKSTDWINKAPHPTRRGMRQCSFRCGECAGCCAMIALPLPCSATDGRRQKCRSSAPTTAHQIPTQDHKSESSTHYPHLASIAAGFFKAHYHQEPDPTNSLLNICGYGD